MYGLDKNDPYAHGGLGHASDFLVQSRSLGILWQIISENQSKILQRFIQSKVFQQLLCRITPKHPLCGIPSGISLNYLGILCRNFCKDFTKTFSRELLENSFGDSFRNLSRGSICNSFRLLNEHFFYDLLEYHVRHFFSKFFQ